MPKKKTENYKITLTMTKNQWLEISYIVFEYINLAPKGSRLMPKWKRLLKALDQKVHDEVMKKEK